MAASFKEKLDRMRASAGRAKASSKLVGLAVMQRGIGTATSAAYGVLEAKGYFKSENAVGEDGQPTLMSRIPKKAAISTLAYIGAIVAGGGAVRQALLGVADSGFYISAHQAGLNGLKVDAIAKTEAAYGVPVEAPEVRVRGLGSGAARIDNINARLRDLANNG